MSSDMTTQTSPQHVKPLPNTPERLLKTRIKHTRIAEVMNDLRTLIYPGSQDSLLLVCGPTGVGKTTIAEYMVSSEMEQAAKAMEDNAGLVPAVYVEAPASGERSFSWRLFFQRILHQLEGESVMPLHAFGINAVTGRMERPNGPSANSLAALRSAVERSLRERGTRFLVIDEAVHIIQQTRPTQLESQLNTLKSLANNSGTQMVLVGSYDLYQLMSLSGQLARRSHVLHFERYRQEDAADIRAFHACVKKFQDELPELWGEKLLQHADALHENTLGCIGTLSAVLMRAAKLAQASGGWSVESLRRALLTEAQHRRILEEILDGEAAINPGLTRTLQKAATQPRTTKRSAA